MFEWTECTSQNPRAYGNKSQYVLAYSSLGYYHVLCFDGHDWYDNDGRRMLERITHWMPLPNKPEMHDPFVIEEQNPFNPFRREGDWW